ncbi:MAG TPA: replication-associated recombination protein A [Alphaproteobacteria bacterium]|nr:replication-associated recombination protein A [Alphaproteobacteria bacterium]
MSSSNELLKELHPLADKLRPSCLNDVVGQAHLLNERGVLRHLLSLSKLPSLVFWGPPGVGKTTLAGLISKEKEMPFEALSAVYAGVSDLKKIFERYLGTPFILFIDEIHRFTKTQQDALLDPIEKGRVTLIGATTENPSFSLNRALLSRVRVLTLKLLTYEDLKHLYGKVSLRLPSPISLKPEVLDYLISLCEGDARRFLNYLEQLLSSPITTWSIENLGEILQKPLPAHDKEGQAHYNLISAMIKSVRGSDPQAALYWFSRMIQAGESPLYIARRLVRLAGEDIGLADPQALIHAQSCLNAYESMGSPEGDLILANSVLYLATAPKSNAAYNAYNKACSKAQETACLSPPISILNAPTTWMKEQGYGKGYVYDHDEPYAYSGQEFMPVELKTTTFYKPVDRGFEREIQKRISFWNKLKESKNL